MDANYAGRMSTRYRSVHNAFLVWLLSLAALSADTAAAAAVGPPIHGAASVAVEHPATAARPLSRAGSAIHNVALECSSERQVVMCSHVAEAHLRLLCCQVHKPVALTERNQRLGTDLAAVAQSEVVALARTTKRFDLHPMSRPGFDSLRAACFVPVRLPAIPANSSQPVDISTQFVPKLSTPDIKDIKLHAMEQLPQANRAEFEHLHWVNSTSGFIHPAAIAGPAELVLMQKRLAGKRQPQYAAQRSLLTGAGVRPKYYNSPETGRKWAAPTDCSPQGYKGPYAVPVVDIDWGGLDVKHTGKGQRCADTFDPNAPQQMCGHLSFVELDAVMAYKQAVAWWATGDARHAQAAIDIIAAWAGNSTHWGVKTRNGPLEAGWGVAGESLNAAAPANAEAENGALLHFIHSDQPPPNPRTGSWYVGLLSNSCRAGAMAAKMRQPAISLPLLLLVLSHGQHPNMPSTQGIASTATTRLVPQPCDSRGGTL